MATVTELRDQLHEEQALRLKLDALVCEAHACLAAAQEHAKHGRDGEASLLMDAAYRVLNCHMTE